ncbi:MAG TPA: CHRD domain-containing protein [Gemmatimonadaceae bacterium]|nr:CHRD domain-containing protein [Gemmatimonadaceae bacterium]
MRRLLTAAFATAAVVAVAGCSDQMPTASQQLVIPIRASDAAALRSPNAPAEDHFHATASGREEVPPNDSRGHGTATFKLSDDGTSLTYRLIVANLENVTQSHIHIAPEGANGPVVVFLFGFVAGGVTENGPLAEGTISQANLIARPAIGFGGTMAELLAAMRSGNAYVNVHTVALPAGEVRGQVR